MTMHLPPSARTLAVRLLRTGFITCFGFLASGASEARVVLVPEAPVTLVRDISVFEVDTPIDVFPGDILTTNPQKGGAQLKDDGGTLAELGVATRVAIGDGRPRTGSNTLGALSLLSGWVKVARAGTAALHDPVQIDTPALQLSVRPGSTVVRAAPTATSVYVEAGAVQVSSPDRAGKRPAPQELTADQFALSELGQPLKRSGRPSPEFVDHLPVIFRDPLRPLQHAPTRDLALAQGHQTSYAEVSEWLTSTLPLRSTFVPRFRSLLHSKPFRTQVEQHVSDLPEWRRVLYPKKSLAPRPTRYARPEKEES
jgi:hypothetical protein